MSDEQTQRPKVGLDLNWLRQHLPRVADMHKVVQRLDRERAESARKAGRTTSETKANG